MTKSLFDMNSTELIDYVQKTPQGERGCDITKSDCTKIVRKIRNNGTTGADVKKALGTSGGIGELFPKLKKPALIKKFTKMTKKKVDADNERIRNKNKGKVQMSDRFDINVNGIQNEIKPINVCKSWSF
eukprot:486006_1